MAAQVFELSSELILGVHPLFPSWWEGESDFELSVTAFRKLDAVVEAKREEVGALPVDSANRSFLIWYHDGHPNLDRRDEAGFAHWRRDLHCRRGELMQIAASLRLREAAPESERGQLPEIEAAERIAGSLRCLRGR